MVEHAAVILNRCEVGHDGKTAHERLNGKKAPVLGIEKEYSSVVGLVL